MKMLSTFFLEMVFPQENTLSVSLKISHDEQIRSITCWPTSAKLEGRLDCGKEYFIRRRATKRSGKHSLCRVKYKGETFPN